MKFFSILFTSILLIMSNMNGEAQSIKPPVAKKNPKILEKHGHQRVDDYYWLNERENPEVIKYLEDENAYTEAIMKHTESLQDKLFEEIKGRIKQTDLSVPYFENAYWYYTRYEEGKEYPIYCRKKGSMEMAEEILLNVNEMAVGQDYYSAFVSGISDDNDLMAFSVDNVGRRKYTIYFKELKTGKILSDKIENTTGGLTWAADNKTVFYTLQDDITLRSDKIFKHHLGTDNQLDTLVFHEEDETYNSYVYRTKSQKYIIIGSATTLANEYQILEANNPEGTFKLMMPREHGHEYNIDHFEDKFYIVTNRNALNFKLMQTSVNQPEEKYWQEVIPHRTDVFLEGIEIFKDYLVVEERIKGLTALRIIEWKDKKEHYLDFGEASYSAGIGYNPEFETKILRYGFSSLVTPGSTFDYDMETRQKTLLKQQEVLGGYESSNYVTERHYAKAQDGVLIPISLVYKKGLKKDSNNPLLLYGYGSYGITIDANFSSARLSLLDRGFVFAIAHIRGGQEMGRQWYEDGKFFKKKNTFTDFIACAEHLIKEKFTNKDKLFANGGSAGGLLMGAVINLRPDLWKGVIAAVPFVDVVTTMLDDSIPLTTGEYDEWGNPNQKDYYDYMLSYSPYDQVERKDCPNLLIITGLHDSQVQYWEPAKWIAKLRALKTDTNTLLMKTDMKAGHSGTTGRFKRFKDTAFEFAFMLDLLGITQ